MRRRAFFVAGLVVAIAVAAGGALRLRGPRGRIERLHPEPEPACRSADLVAVDGVLVRSFACAGKNEAWLRSAGAWFRLPPEAGSPSSPRFLHRSPGHWVLLAGAAYFRSDDGGQHVAWIHAPEVPEGALRAGRELIVDPDDPMRVRLVTTRNPSSHERVRELVHGGTLSPSKLLDGWRKPEAGHDVVTTWTSDDGGDSWSRR